MNNMNNLGSYFANLQFNWHSVVAIIIALVVLYVAFRIGAIILKIVVGLAFIAFLIFALSKFLPYIGL